MEKRREQRISVTLPVKYWKVHDGSAHTGMAFDITKRGFSLKGSGDLTIEDTIHFELKMIDRSVLGTAMILWGSKPSGRASAQRVGCLILSFAEDNMRILDEYLDRIMVVKVHDE
ncbi:MAG: hypothetical protein V1753_11810 [Pseudomonadota bacterium]